MIVKFFLAEGLPPGAPKPVVSGFHVELPEAVVKALERLGSPMLEIDAKHDLGPLVSLGSKSPTMIRPGLVAQVFRPRQEDKSGITTITTTRGFVFNVDEDYRSVQEKLGGKPYGVSDWTPPEKDSKPRGQCADCGEMFHLKRDGTLRAHKNGTVVCVGSGKPPEDTA